MIYLDMDGVLADFDGWLRDLGIQNENSFIHKPRKEWTPEQVELDKIVVAKMATPGFFRNLPPLPGHYDLWLACENATALKGPHVLTAKPLQENDDGRVEREKREWITEQFGDIGRRFHCVVRSQKQDFAIRTTYASTVGCAVHEVISEEPNILVDDLPKNCEEWEKAGGIAILYTNANQAIKDLSKIVNS